MGVAIALCSVVFIALSIKRERGRRATPASARATLAGMLLVVVLVALWIG